MIESSFLPPDVSGLVAALAIGLLIGLERGWQDRELPEGSRVAGLRTFTLTGLLGGVLGHLQPNFGALAASCGRIRAFLITNSVLCSYRKNFR